MSTINVTPLKPIGLNRLLRADALPTVAATLANLILYLVADALWRVAWEPKFDALLVVVGTLGALVAAAAVFAVVARVGKNPVKTYTTIATVVLLLSLVPPVLA